jgi:hypothetical protein
MSGHAWMRSSLTSPADRLLERGIHLRILNLGIDPTTPAAGLGW